MPPTRKSIPLAERLSLTVAESLAATGLSRTRFYSLVARGELRTFTVGRRRFVPGDELRAWIAGQSANVTPIAPEVSAQRSIAGRLGRASQLATRDKTAPKA